MIDEVIQWLRDGNENDAADLLAECYLSDRFVDLAFELGGGDREITITDVIIEAPRKILDQVPTTLSNLVQEIEKAVRDCAQSTDSHVRHISWVPKLPATQKPFPDEEVSAALARADSGHVRAAWEKALRRKSADPEGAITAARALIESVCKHVLDEAGIQYRGDADLPELYHLAVQLLNLAPSQQSDDLTRKVLGNCVAVVGGLAALRNKLGDAHGKGANEAIPTPSQSELAVNLAGAVALFLVSVWQDSRAEQENRS